MAFLRRFNAPASNKKSPLVVRRVGGSNRGQLSIRCLESLNYSIAHFLATRLRIVPAGFVRKAFAGRLRLSEAARYVVLIRKR